MAVSMSHTKLDLAVSSDSWLLPSNMIINTESVIGYNNKLQRASQDMKFGVNNYINLKTQKIYNPSTNTSKIKLPHQQYKDEKLKPEIVEKSTPNG